MSEPCRLGLFICKHFLKIFIYIEDLTVVFTKVKFIQLQQKG